MCQIAYQLCDISCFEKFEVINEKKLEARCILAHCKQTDKIIQAISVIQVLLTSPAANKINRVLVLSPTNRLSNWREELQKIKKSLNIYYILEDDGIEIITISIRLSIIEQWYQKGGVLLLDYDMFELLTKGDCKEDFIHLLIKPDFVIEG